MSLTYLWGRRVSDEQITIESGLLNKLLPGDIVLADGGFNIGDSVGFTVLHYRYLHSPRGGKSCQRMRWQKLEK